MLEIANQKTLPVANRLEFLSLNALKKMAKRLGLPASDGKRARIAAALVDFIGTPRHREFLEKRLSADDWSLFNRVPFHIGAFPFYTLLVALRERGDSPKDALAKIEDFLALGCIMYPVQPPGSSNAGIDQQTLRYLGSEILLHLAPGVAGWARANDPSPFGLQSVPPPATIAEPRFVELQRAVFILTTEASRKPIRLTLKSPPYRNEITRLALALAGGSSATGRGRKKKLDPAGVPPILWFALASLMGANLLQLDGQELHPSDEATPLLSATVEQQVYRLLNGWLNGPFNDFARVSTLALTYDALESGRSTDPWFNVDDDGYGPTHPIVARARALIIETLSAVTASARDAWYSIDDFSALVYHQNHEILFARHHPYDLLNETGDLRGHRGNNQPMPYYGVHRAIDGRSDDSIVDQQTLDQTVLYLDRDWREVEGAFIRQIVVESLRWLGVVEVGPGDGSPSCFRLSEPARNLFDGKLPAAPAVVATGHAVVQPNYDVVVVDAFANGSLLAQLDAFAERRSLDRAATYRLTQADLIRGLDRGWSGERVFKLLEDANGGPLPQNVGYTLREWIANYERLAIHQNAALLDVDRPAEIDGWLADGEISSLLGKRLGPTSILVPSRNLAMLATVLGGRGIPLATRDYRQPWPIVLNLSEPDLIDVSSKDLDPYLTYRLAALADPIERDRKKVIYQITRESIARAMQSGWAGQALIDFLGIASGDLIPDDFFTRLVGWSGESPLSSEPLIAVTVPNGPLDWDILEGIPAIGQLIRATPTNQLALVAPGDLEALRTELATRGLALQAARLDRDDLEAVGADDERDLPAVIDLGRLLASAPAFSRTGSSLDDLALSLFGRPRGKSRG